MELLSNKCILGIPFSANNMYAPTKKGGMAKTKKYRAWIEINEALVAGTLKPATKFPISVNITVVGGRGWPITRDVDNTIKPLMDILVRAKIIPDDKTEFVRDVKASYMPFSSMKSEAITHITYEEPDELEVSEWDYFAFKKVEEE